MLNIIDQRQRTQRYSQQSQTGGLEANQAPVKPDVGQQIGQKFVNRLSLKVI